MSDKEFVNGLNIKAPHENAPEFVKCKISIKRKDLGNWLRGRDEDWINLDVKVSQEGKWYAVIDTWKPNQNSSQDNSGHQSGQPADDMDDEIPF